MKASVIVLSWNGMGYLANCLNAVLTQDCAVFEVIISAAHQNQAGATLADELLSLREVHERPFTSQVPILGSWIVAFRKLWNSVATQWYVRPMLSQQVQFNGAVVRALLQLHTNHWDEDALLTLLAERCGTMAARVADLRDRLEQAEEQLRVLRGKTHE